ncbi:MAG: Flp pilus assembly protein CpaB [Acidobacteria bacterium]|nr:MAG: Flp pilus assembly protein CpaB [Acidobacteriota bacterium]
MDRRTRTFVVMAVAVVSATVASASVYRAVTRVPARTAPVPHSYVVLASRALPLGAQVESSPVGDHEPITEAKLAPREAGAGLAPTIPAGMRAISVRVNEVIGVAGFAGAGAHVDVVATVRKSGDAVSRVLLSNIPVLTTGTRAEQEQKHDDKLSVVTLIVTPAQAERIALASAEGSLTLMLRNPLDQANPITPGAELAALMGGGDNRAPRPVATTGAAQPVQAVARVQPTPLQAPAAPAAVYTVDVIRAGKLTRETVQ